MSTPRDPATSLDGCRRILVLGRTGSGKTTLARQLAAARGVPHVELDALYFDSDLRTVPLELLRLRATEAIAGDHWVIDGNKKALRDLIWPRADTVVWLDYPLVVGLWRLSKRALRRTSHVRDRSPAAGTGGSDRFAHLARAAKGVLTALRSHRGQRRKYPRMFAEPRHRHLAVVRLRTPRSTRRWLARVSS